MSNHFVPAMATSGRRGTGLTMTPMDTSGYLEPGYRFRRLASCGHLAIGAGAMAFMFSTRVTGVRRSDFMAGSTMDSATSAWDTRADIGIMARSSTIGP